MMTSSWQDAATAVILLMTLGYLAYRAVRMIRRKGFPACGCGMRCLDLDKGEDSHPEPLVKLNEPRQEPPYK
jgi:hypothetical protein